MSGFKDIRIGKLEIKAQMSIAVQRDAKFRLARMSEMLRIAALVYSNGLSSAFIVRFQ
jgi:hypothetical protein